MWELKSTAFEKTVCFTPNNTEYVIKAEGGFANLIYRWGLNP